jgi:hypothetical protein
MKLKILNLPSTCWKQFAYTARPLVIALVALISCTPSTMSSGSFSASGPTQNSYSLEVTPPSPDPRVGLRAGLFNAGEAAWNMRVVSATPPPEEFVGITNSDLAFKGDYAIQGNYNGVQVWDISDPTAPTTVTTFICPASQSDVSVFGDLMFVSGEGMTGRLDCSDEGIQEAVSHDRLRGIRIFDITDIRNPNYVTNVQTCRGSHTHTVLEDPNDQDNVYIYVSGSAPVRPEEELAGCSNTLPSEDPNSALFRIEVIKVPLANPEDAAIVSSPRIFNDLVAPPEHGLAPEDIIEMEEARAGGAFIFEMGGYQRVLPSRMTDPLLAQLVERRGGSGSPTAADSASLRALIPDMMAQRAGANSALEGMGPTQCHDITVYPHLGIAGGACEGYGMLLDISNPIDPIRLAAVADSNFSYWHSATFNNDGTKVLFTDEWGGGGSPKCRATDPKEWGANALFTLDDDGNMDFKSYFKLPAPQTSLENCVAHNGSLIPIPGRDIMVQSWYQGGISIFDWTDINQPTEIAYHDRGPTDASRMGMGGSWSVYWYNGMLVSSEIARGLDIFELTPSDAISQNEIDAANTVKFEQLNSQGQPELVWPFSFSLAKAYIDQLERSNAMPSTRINTIRANLAEAESESGAAKRATLSDLSSSVRGMADQSRDANKVQMLADALEGLAEGS